MMRKHIYCSTLFLCSSATHVQAQSAVGGGSYASIPC